MSWSLFATKNKWKDEMLPRLCSDRTWPLIEPRQRIFELSGCSLAAPQVTQNPGHSACCLWTGSTVSWSNFRESNGLASPQDWYVLDHGFEDDPEQGFVLIYYRGQTLVRCWMMPWPRSAMSSCSFGLHFFGVHIATCKRIWCPGWLNQTTNIPKMATKKIGQWWPFINVYQL